MGQKSSASLVTSARQICERVRPAQRTQQILAAAFEEFAANGYEATRLDDVVRRAHVAKGTVYLHFKNKEALFRAVVRSRIRSLFEGFGAHAENFPGSAEELLRQLLSRQYTAMVKNEKARGILRLLIAESRKFPQLAEIYRREVIEPATRAMRAALERGIASGEFEPRNVADFPQILAAPALLAAVWMLILGQPAPFDLDAYLQAHLELATAGLRKASVSCSGGQAEPAGGGQ